MAAAAPGGVQVAIQRPVVSSPTLPHQQLVDQLWMTVRALGWRAVEGVGSYAVGGSRGAWEDFIRNAERPRLDHALDAATRALADLNGHPAREPGEDR
jgi:hypothetical protein